MAVRASSIARGAMGGVTSLYFEDDRVEVGTTNMTCQEELRRIAYRDVRRIVSWPESRRSYMFVGVMFAVVAAVVLLAALTNEDSGVFAALMVGVGGATLLAAGCLYAGRPGGITRLRIEGVRGTLEATLGGTARKRARVLEELERRILERQSAR